MSAFTTNPIADELSPIVRKIIKTPKGFLPNINPIINSLSTYTSKVGVYTVVYITGSNFFPFGTTSVKFGPYINIPVTYYSSFNISFVLPITSNNITSGNYIIQVTSINNSKLFPNILYSNKVTYTLT